jgi:small GTP-binding protein
MKRLVIGMTAHVDSGKTTLTEALLYRAGEIRKPGRVDHGDAFLDNNPLERSRGITIFSKQAVLHYGENEFTLLDTPGHVDFSAEAERALSVLDCAVLVISGTDGVQSHTETLWRLLARYNVPTFIFVNKTDISHLPRESLLNELKRKLGAGCIDFTGENLAEQAAECDEDCMNGFLESGEVTDELLCEAICRRHIFPVCFGSALKFSGIDEFLEILARYTKPLPESGDFGAIVYKITQDESGARLTHIKINSGVLRVKTAIDPNAPTEKVNRIRV